MLDAQVSFVIENLAYDGPQGCNVRRVVDLIDAYRLRRGETNAAATELQQVTHVLQKLLDDSSVDMYVGASADGFLDSVDKSITVTQLLGSPDRFRFQLAEERRRRILNARQDLMSEVKWRLLELIAFRRGAGISETELRRLVPNESSSILLDDMAKAGMVALLRWQDAHHETPGLFMLPQFLPRDGAALAGLTSNDEHDGTPYREMITDVLSKIPSHTLGWTALLKAARIPQSHHRISMYACQELEAAGHVKCYWFERLSRTQPRVFAGWVLVIQLSDGDTSGRAQQDECERALQEEVGPEAEGVVLYTSRLFDAVHDATKNKMSHMAGTDGEPVNASAFMDQKYVYQAIADTIDWKVATWSGNDKRYVTLAEYVVDMTRSEVVLKKASEAENANSGHLPREVQGNSSASQINSNEVEGLTEMQAHSKAEQDKSTTPRGRGRPRKFPENWNYKLRRPYTEEEMLAKKKLEEEVSLRREAQAEKHRLAALKAKQTRAEKRKVAALTESDRRSEAEDAECSSKEAEQVATNVANEQDTATGPVTKRPRRAVRAPERTRQDFVMLPDEEESREALSNESKAVLSVLQADDGVCELDSNFYSHVSTQFGATVDSRVVKRAVKALEQAGLARLVVLHGFSPQRRRISMQLVVQSNVSDDHAKLQTARNHLTQGISEPSAVTTHAQTHEQEDHIESDQEFHAPQQEHESDNDDDAWQEPAYVRRHARTRRKRSQRPLERKYELDQMVPETRKKPLTPEQEDFIVRGITILNILYGQSRNLPWSHILAHFHDMGFVRVEELRNRYKVLKTRPKWQQVESFLKGYFPRICKVLVSEGSLAEPPKNSFDLRLAEYVAASATAINLPPDTTLQDHKPIFLPDSLQELRECYKVEPIDSEAASMRIFRLGHSNGPNTLYKYDILFDESQPPIRRKKQVLQETADLIPYVEHSISAVLPLRQSTSAYRQLTTLIKSAMLTPAERHNSNLSAAEMRAALEDADLRALVTDMQTADIIKRSAEEHRLPGSQFEPTQRFADRLEKPSIPVMTIADEARRFIKQLNNAPKGLPDISSLATGGMVATLLHELPTGHVELDVPQPVWQAGPMREGYKAKALDRELIHFPVSVKHVGDEMSTGADTGAEDFVAHLNASAPVTQAPQFWRAAGGALIPGMWERTVGAVLSAIMIRPRLSRAKLQQRLEPLLEPHELDQVLVRLEELGCIRTTNDAIDATFL